MIDQQQQKINIPVESSTSYPVSSNATDRDEINILEYVYVLVKNKWWITGFAVLGLIAGYVTAIIKGPTYKAEAVIAAKENDSKSTPNLSGFGALGGLVASQLNFGGNPGLDKIELILGSKKFSAELVKKYNLLPEVIKNLSPKVYKSWYDTTKSEWRDGFEQPNLLAIGFAVSNKFLKRETNNNNTMTITVESKDSTFTDSLLSVYLQYLNVFIQNTVRTEAKENVSYLEKQLLMIADPLLREKLQGMIANELEKEMLVSKEAFKIVDPPLRSIQFREKKILPLIFSMALTLIIIILVLISHSFFTGIRLPEDKRYLDLIKQNLFMNKTQRK